MGRRKRGSTGRGKGLGDDSTHTLTVYPSRSASPPPIRNVNLHRAGVVNNLCRCRVHGRPALQAIFLVCLHDDALALLAAGILDMHTVAKELNHYRIELVVRLRLEIHTVIG